MAKKQNEVKSTTTLVDTKLQEENNLLKSKLEKMEEMLTSLMKQNQELENRPEKIVEVVRDIDKTPEIVDIPLNKVVKVMSLYTGVMNLKTAENGKIFKFNNFGDVQPIIYNDLIQIMSHQHRFCTEGYFTILDKDVVIAHGLEDNYKKILDKKVIENILTYDEDKIKELFSGTTKNIKESIVSILINKINGNENVDKNKIHIISELYGIDLFAYARGDVDVLVNSKISK
jgi:hypothetical protein